MKKLTVTPFGVISSEIPPSVFMVGLYEEYTNKKRIMLEHEHGAISHKVVRSSSM